MSEAADAARLVLIAPFRTTLDYSTLMTAEDRRTLATTLEAVTAAANARAAGSTMIWRATPPDDRSQLKWNSLDEDNVDHDLLPILTYQAPAPSDSDGHRTDPIVALPEHLDHVDLLEVQYYDNTVALLIAQIQLTPDARPGKGLELETTAWVRAVVDHLQPAESSLLRMAASELTQWDGRMAEQLRRLTTNAVQALTPGSAREQPERDVADRLMWVTRLWIEPTAPDALPSARARALSNWAGGQIEPGPEVEGSTHLIAPHAEPDEGLALGDTRLFICEGNSVLVGSPTADDMAALRRTVVPMMSMYVLHDVLHGHARICHREIASTARPTKEQLDDGLSTVELCEFSINDYNDLVRGFQGSRQAMVIELERAWRSRSLLTALERRKDALQTAIDNALQVRQTRYNRVVEAILTLIGGFALLDLALNLFSFAGRAPQDGDVPGLIDIARHAPLDGSLYVLLLCAIGVTLLVAGRRA